MQRKLTCNVSIPPLSEAASPTKSAKTVLRGSYIVESGLHPPYHILLVGRTKVNPDRSIFHCRVLNLTNKTIRLRKGSTIGELMAATVIESHPQQQILQKQNLPSIAEMRKHLSRKQCRWRILLLKEKILTIL
jgi:hypothetical protein